jgi:hypothetical protein
LDSLIAPLGTAAVSNTIDSSSPDMARSSSALLVALLHPVSGVGAGANTIFKLLSLDFDPFVGKELHN